MRAGGLGMWGTGEAAGRVVLQCGDHPRSGLCSAAVMVPRGSSV